MKPIEFHEIERRFIENSALVYFASFLGLLGGLAITLAHNIWAMDWRG